MKRRLTILLSLLLVVIVMNAQYETVDYDYERNWFDENTPVPSQSYWTMNGDIPQGVERVELGIYTSSKIDRKKPIYTSLWRMGLSDERERFFIPVNIKLRENKKYSYVISYYASMSEGEINELRRSMGQTILSYLRTNIVVSGNKVKMNQSTNVMYDELNEIIKSGLTYYRLDNIYTFETLNSLVLDKLEQLRRLNLKKADDNLHNAEDVDMQLVYFETIFSELYQMCVDDLDQYLNTNVLKMVDSKIITDYPTDNKPFYLRLNIGYAGVYHSGGFKDMCYGGVPYVGISIPFANPDMRNNFASRSSISFGVFLKKIKFNGLEQPVGGPLITIPAYVAYGFKPVSFLRLNLGITALRDPDNNSSDYKGVYVRPFIGVAFELNLSAKFDK